MRYEKISRPEFDSSNFPILFQNVKYARSYGTITDSDCCFRFSWRSDLIEPEIKDIGGYHYSVGVDQNYCLIDIQTKKTILDLELFFSFLSSELHNDFIFINTEMEVIRICKKDLTTEEIDLPDFFSELTYVNGEVQAKCVDGTIVSLMKNNG
jgi:hypothetical protein